MEEYGPIESLDERVYRFKQYVASLNFDLKDTLRHPHIFEPKRKKISCPSLLMFNMAMRFSKRCCP
jgi:hypothetical protein